MQLRLRFPGRQPAPPGPRPPTAVLSLMSLLGGSPVASPGMRNARLCCKPSQRQAPQEQMFLFKADRNCRDHFSPHQFSSSGGSCLPGTQSRILMTFVAEPGLRDGGLTNTRMRLLRNPGRELATGHFYIVWKSDLFSGRQFHILKSVINGNCQFSLISAKDCC